MREQQHNNAPCLGAATTCNATSPSTSACYAGQRDLLDHAVLPILSAVRPVSRAQLDKIARNATKLLVKDGGVVRRIHKNENVKFAFTYKGKGVAEKHDFGSWISIDAVASVNAMKTQRASCSYQRMYFGYQAERLVRQ